MNPFMKPLYEEFEENLYRLFSLKLDEGELNVAENA